VNLRGAEVEVRNNFRKKKKVAVAWPFSCGNWPMWVCGCRYW